ncbi:GNAT family N-acetyltransferase [[Bacillus] enclensis]|uniref:GNAT family N-acetyltransferase n=1 Tax=[Bacillus] enclensis TaxID=1402860 RepID=UPI0018DC357D|nr:GNAT family N-acetyltransferase [[Bacillus] enclensis]MBH9966294.1 GNAT family N-acetyltransferase [[Bacillus] enclensis]
MKLDIKEEFHTDDLEEMKAVYQSVGWMKHSPEVIKQVFESSNVIVIVKAEEQVVGFGRALSDGVFNAAIYDIVVRREFQNQGIARKIMTRLLDRLQGVSCVHLISTSGNEEFYKKCGFRKVKTGMARYIREKLQDEYLE